MGGIHFNIILYAEKRTELIDCCVYNILRQKRIMNEIVFFPLSAFKSARVRQGIIATTQEFSLTKAFLRAIPFYNTSVYANMHTSVQGLNEFLYKSRIQVLQKVCGVTSKNDNFYRGISMLF